jgi:esterase/lipase superfamily enzyme
MAILIVTNRNLNRTRNDEYAFGDGFNAKGPMELRLATARKEDGNWRVDVVPESNLSEARLPSSQVFKDFRSHLIDERRNCVFFVHGFNQSLLKNLNKCAELESYGVDVVAFSWPSNPGGFKPKEYKKAKRAAEISAPALDRVIDKMCIYFREYFEKRCNVSFNMVVHSLGNYVFQNYAEKRSLEGEGRIFDNLILHQADVDSDGHGDWASELKNSKRIYITHNENDKVLDISDIVNPDRLGNTPGNSEVPFAKYIDFTDADKVGRDHRPWHQARQNPVVEAFYTAVFNGQKAERVSGIAYDDEQRMYKVP